jgi:hypothetical protein
MGLALELAGQSWQDVRVILLVPDEKPARMDGQPV